MACSCLFSEISYDKGFFLCGGGVSSVEDFFCEFLLFHASFLCDVSTFTRMCLSSVAAGYGLGGSLLSSCGPLASTHA